METGIRTIKEIIGYHYLIPKYQRGYRWTKTNVLQLLEDIYENKLIDSMEFNEYQIEQINQNNTHFKAMCKKVALEDADTAVWESKEEHKYCIQPLVVNKLSNGSYTVIDGQQRLTTIAIMLAVIKFLEGNNSNNNVQYPNIQLNYQSRPKSEELVKSLYEVTSIEDLKSKYSGNIDFDYMIWAFESALEYYKDVSEKFANKFSTNVTKEYFKYLRFVLLNCVQFIWYDASLAVFSSNEQKVFANFNTGKLPLTNAELIKAIFMNPANFGEATSNTNKIKDRQINISETWDMIETALHDSDFWAFIPHPNQYSFCMKDRENEKYEETRIDVIFDFLVRKNRIGQSDSVIDSYATYIAIDKWISYKLNGQENKREIMDECWNDVKRIFSSLRELYEDKDNSGKLFNLLGVYIYISNLRKTDGTFYTSIISNGVAYNTATNVYLEVFDFLSEVSEIPRDKRVLELKKKLKKMIFGNSYIAEFVRNIRYSEMENDKITACLLLYNILKLNQSNGAGSRFNFLEFAKHTWQREHIFATQNEGVSKDIVFRKSVLQELIQPLGDFDNQETLKNNSYVNYLNYRDRGNELAFPEEGEIACSDSFNTLVKFLKTASDIQLRYQLIENAEKIIDLEKMLLNKNLHSIRTRLVDEIINYRDKNKFIFSELVITEIANKVLEKNNNILKIEDFQSAVIECLYKDLLMDCTTQIENIFKNYEGDMSPYKFLTTPEQNQDIPQKYLNKNIITAYRNKLKGLIWFSSEDKEAIDLAEDKEKEFLNRRKDWKEKKQYELLGITDREDESDDVENDIQAVHKASKGKYIEILNISDEDNLKFVINAVKLNVLAMREKIDHFFAQDGIYCQNLADNSMGNMALLSGSDNAAIRNYSFCKKSEIIFRKSKTGCFIPLETLMVFTGAYSMDAVTVKEWSPKSRLNYLKEIISTLNMLEVE